MDTLQKDRYLEDAIRDDLQHRMVFIGGPRQVGKTTLARMLGERFAHSAYLNWDNRAHRQLILKGQWQPEAELLVFDELHKYDRWKSLVKGIWDTRQRGERIIVTGSSRLDVFRRQGDSLLGRYRYYRLHPFSLREICSGATSVPPFPRERPQLLFDEPQDDVEVLLKFGGFPEPCLAGSDRVLKRWQKERFERVFREDIRETEAVRSLAQVELLGSLLPQRVAAPLSINSLSEDIEASPKTLKNWIELLCRNYYIFKVPPYHRRLERALKKEAKYYLWDWSEVEEEGRRFENMVAAHLLKFCHFYEDLHGIRAELYYLRDLEKREVDFLVTWEKEPWFLVECKRSAPKNFTHLQYFAGKLGVADRYCVTLAADRDYQDRQTGIRVIPAGRFLLGLV
ncbi:MAG: ATP-binding protein [Candidatus Latescibacteria bacterium]|nr:ATP-binding protein [Candidatus Latescibacterota bacterium]